MLYTVYYIVLHNVHMKINDSVKYVYDKNRLYLFHKNLLIMIYLFIYYSFIWFVTHVCASRYKSYILESDILRSVQEKGLSHKYCINNHNKQILCKLDPDNSREIRRTDVIAETMNREYNGRFYFNWNSISCYGFVMVKKELILKELISFVCDRTQVKR